MLIEIFLLWPWGFLNGRLAPVIYLFLVWQYVPDTCYHFQPWNQPFLQELSFLLRENGIEWWYSGARGWALFGDFDKVDRVRTYIYIFKKDNIIMGL